MHRATPLSSSFRAYTGGGTRSAVDTVDDSKMMQEHSGNFMSGETRSGVEAPQNYGFTSVAQPATKDENGKITDSAESVISFMGGNRSFPVAGVMDDRRFRPYGLKSGENSQYDDLGQMTLLRRTGLYLLSLDNPDESPSAKQQDGQQQQQPQRFVSIRHVVKEKQPRPKQGQQSTGNAPATSSARAASQSQQQQDFQHEGQSVNLEIRVSAGRIEFRSGDTVVGYYDKEKATWVLIGTVDLGAASGVVPVGILGSIDTAGDKLVAAMATKVNAE